MTFTVAGTGHRPPRLGLGYDPESNRRLTRFAEHQLSLLLEEHAKAEVYAGTAKVISGMAQGWDQALAHAALNVGIPLICALPFEGQESKWPPAGQARYRAILSRASQVVVVCKGGYANWKFARRDEWMVDHANFVLALKDRKPESSGTSLTVDYAEAKGVPVKNVWDEWEAVRGT